MCWSMVSGELMVPWPLLSLTIGDGEDVVGDRGNVGGETLDRGCVDCGMETGKRSSETSLTGDCERLRR